MQFRTMTGTPVESIMDELDRQLEASAYKAISGGTLSGFTDIKPAYMYVEFNRIFGPVGIGWKYWYDGGLRFLTPDDLGADGKEDMKGLDKTAWTPEVAIMYAYFDEAGQRYWSEPVMMPGYNRNGGSAVDSLKGAITSGLGSAASIMGWQKSVYMGKRTHEKQYVATETPAPTISGTGPIDHLFAAISVAEGDVRSMLAAALVPFGAEAIKALMVRQKIAKTDPLFSVLVEAGQAAKGEGEATAQHTNGTAPKA